MYLGILDQTTKKAPAPEITFPFSITCNLLKSSDGVCEVYQLEDIQQYERVMNASSDIQKPQQLDLVAKELFFSKGVVFLEGAEDKSVFSQYFLQNVNEPIYFDFFDFPYGRLRLPLVFICFP